MPARTRISHPVLLALATLILLALALASLATGDMPLTPAQILHALLHPADTTLATTIVLATF